MKSQICSADQPLIAELGQHSGNQAQSGRRIGKDAHHASPAADFPVQAFYAIGGADQASMSGREGEDRESFRNVRSHPFGQAGRSLAAQAEALDEDKQTATALETVISAYERELHNELPPRLAEVENILHRLEQRGLDFFDSTIRLTNVQNLVRGDKVRAQFEKQVLTDVPQQIKDQVQRLIDWLVQKDLHEWQQVMSYLQRRRAQNLDHMVGESYAPRETRRRELIDTVGKTVQTIVESYDRDKEGSELFSRLRRLDALSWSQVIG